MMLTTGACVQVRPEPPLNHANDLCDHAHRATSEKVNTKMLQAGNTCISDMPIRKCTSGLVEQKERYSTHASQAGRDGPLRLRRSSIGFRDDSFPYGSLQNANVGQQNSGGAKLMSAPHA